MQILSIPRPRCTRLMKPLQPPPWPLTERRWVCFISEKWNQQSVIPYIYDDLSFLPEEYQWPECCCGLLAVHVFFFVCFCLCGCTRSLSNIFLHAHLLTLAHMHGFTLICVVICIAWFFINNGKRQQNSQISLFKQQNVFFLEGCLHNNWSVSSHQHTSYQLFLLCSSGGICHLLSDCNTNSWIQQTSYNYT